MKQKKQPSQEELVQLAKLGGNDASLHLLDRITSLEDDVATLQDEIAKDPPEDRRIEKIASRVSSQLAVKMAVDAQDFVPTDEHLKELITPLIPPAIKGDAGDAYTLTEDDKKEIAQSVVIPTVEIEKVIEKTETIREQPIVTEVVKEVALLETADKIRDKLETLKDEDRLDISAIKGIDKREEALAESVTQRAIGIVDQRSSFSINKAAQLRVDVNTKVTGWGTKNIYVQSTQPANPSLLDIWIDLS